MFSNSELEQPADKLYTVLENRQIVHEEPTIKIQVSQSQESGMSFRKEALRMNLLSCNFAD